MLPELKKFLALINRDKPVTLVLLDSGGAEPGPIRAWARASARNVNDIHYYFNDIHFFYDDIHFILIKLIIIKNSHTRVKVIMSRQLSLLNFMGSRNPTDNG